VRLFVAVEPPPRVVQHLESALDHTGLRQRHSDLRWVPAAQWHLTLAFFGEVARDRLGDLSVRLARAAARHPPMPARVMGAETFGPGSRARVLWAGIHSDETALTRLAESVAAAGRRAGINLGPARFRAHLTLARVRALTDLTDCVEALAAYQGPDWTIDEIRLVRSVLGAGPNGRPAHSSVQRWPLAGG
jgi:2'-5' RNA ligase